MVYIDTRAPGVVGGPARLQAGALQDGRPVKGRGGMCGFEILEVGHPMDTPGMRSWVKGTASEGWETPGSPLRDPMNGGTGPRPLCRRMSEPQGHWKAGNVKASGPAAPILSVVQSPAVPAWRGPYGSPLFKAHRLREAEVLEVQDGCSVARKLAGNPFRSAGRFRGTVTW